MRRAFAWLVLGMAIFMLARELPRFVGTPMTAIVIAVVALGSLALALAPRGPPDDADATSLIRPFTRTLTLDPEEPS